MKKIFPIVIKLGDGKDFDRNGVIQLEDCDEIYVWMPSYGIVSGKYKFCDKNGYVIKYLIDATTKIGKYQI